MIYVTDTHPFVFYALGTTRKLGRNALRVFTRAEKRQDTIYIPSICFFELALLVEGGKVRSPMPFSDWKAVGWAPPTTLYLVDAELAGGLCHSQALCRGTPMWVP